MNHDNREPNPDENDTASGLEDAPAANPAYATPPPEGIPDADND
ncbi:hypothetical protein ACAG24_001110 [Mycobacterium sp. pW049]